ncbi:MAG TPA: hypothetical protein VFU18_01980, partial [Actinomycetota bacterium]|nr:hypothetical protein [Actinomycetota bacterium]
MGDTVARERFIGSSRIVGGRRVGGVAEGFGSGLGGVAEGFGSGLGGVAEGFGSGLAGVLAGHGGLGLTARVGHRSQVLVGRNGRDPLGSARGWPILGAHEGARCPPGRCLGTGDHDARDVVDV